MNPHTLPITLAQDDHFFVISNSNGGGGIRLLQTDLRCVSYLDCLSLLVLGGQGRVHDRLDADHDVRKGGQPIRRLVLAGRQLLLQGAHAAPRFLQIAGQLVTRLLVAITVLLI